MSSAQISNQHSTISHRLWLMVAVLLIATAFRFLAVDAAPPGWRDDELIEYGMDRRIADGWRPLFITEAEGHEPVYHYLHAGTILSFGDNIVGYKWLPMAFGLLTIALTYALARKMFDAPTVALLAAALMAVSFWPIMYARFGVRHIGTLP
jgi:4-amino-4-deoxy-L-arabinose transferase-like glycosyltransferase